MNEQNHRSKYETHLIIGLLLLAGFTVVVFHAIQKSLALGSVWYFFTGLAIVLIGTAAYFISSATVHKVKSDLLRKSRKKTVQDTNGEEI